MNVKNKPNATKRPTLEEEVADIERLSPAEIDAELRRLNIDAEPAIRKVKEMVKDKLAEWRRRGVLHAEHEMTHTAGDDD